MGMKVVVIGGGIGGLALAQGLNKAGLEVAVFERDRTPTERMQGYRVHINRAGSRALHACLPPQLFDAFVATAAAPNPRAGIGMYDHRLRELIWFDAAGDATKDPVESDKSVSRISLRQVLLVGLDDVVRFGKTFTHYEVNPDGTVTAHFGDGTSESGDVLVGADGGSSRVRQQYLPNAPRVDTGVIGIQGKVWLTETSRASLPARLADGPAMVVGSGGYGMFLAIHEFPPLPAELAGIVGAKAGNQRDYLMWGLLARRGKFPADLDRLDDSGLAALASDRIAEWHPAVRNLVAATDLETVLLTPIRTSTQADAWPASTVTLLGDAIHSMPPTAGVGANTALRDAQLLTGNLSRAAVGEIPLLDAIADYETRMREYGYAAVRASTANLRRQQRTENPLALAGMKLALRVLNNIPAAKRRALAEP
ncbi:2-polyprenyl-6-methoxyphenol hydroxylase [Micromonospora rhizosphaerae]|uniref:2-polyprenyl-6-methoxyphenol hydroxylase n=1 Tax=Micromonospora rhizosphaerae TaxID=568872 RepID=A0A1C6SDA8_9ACTN|nr:NAD(P)/FAD-dependent oxidoreductase [Micromonospora rhizosphaerae]SCL27476.1 2-polyprenyl-6-methoxyphenol hydroxylase [Micromonospora rhizosphaerae]